MLGEYPGVNLHVLHQLLREDGRMKKVRRQEALEFLLFLDRYQGNHEAEQAARDAFHDSEINWRKLLRLRCLSLRRHVVDAEWRFWHGD